MNWVSKCQGKCPIITENVVAIWMCSQLRIEDGQWPYDQYSMCIREEVGGGKYGTHLLVI